MDPQTDLYGNTIHTDIGGREYINDGYGQRQYRDEPASDPSPSSSPWNTSGGGGGYDGGSGGGGWGDSPQGDSGGGEAVVAEAEEEVRRLDALES